MKKLKNGCPNGLPLAKKVVTIIKSLPQFPKAGRIVPEYNDENWNCLTPLLSGRLF